MAIRTYLLDHALLKAVVIRVTVLVLWAFAALASHDFGITVDFSTLVACLLWCARRLTMHCGVSVLVVSATIARCQSCDAERSNLLALATGLLSKTAACTVIRFILVRIFRARTAFPYLGLRVWVDFFTFVAFLLLFARCQSVVGLILVRVVWTFFVTVVVIRLTVRAEYLTLLTCYLSDARIVRPACDARQFFLNFIRL